MYRIRLDSIRLKSLTDAYLLKYKDDLQKEIEGFLNGEKKCAYSHSVGRTKRRTFLLKSNSTSSSFSYGFLKRCCDPNDDLLDKLLIGDFKTQLSIIRLVYNDSQTHFDSLTANKADTMGYVNGQVVDDFNAILYEIFVNRSFDGDGKSYALPLDKDAFVKDLGIRVCPYCGRAFVFRVEKKGKNGIVSVKPQLDHFLPKRKYPFLAMNFYNLVPCCTQCNMAPCKVDNDPLDSTLNRIQFLMHPYVFDENEIRFVFRLNAPNTYDPDSYDIMVGYKNKDLKRGYNDFLAIDKVYAGHRVELNNMFIRARSFHVLTNGLYKKIGIYSSPIPSLNQFVLGFNFSKREETRQLMYKFNKDTFLQMAQNHHGKKAETFFADWDGIELCISIK